MSAANAPTPLRFPVHLLPRLGPAPALPAGPPVPEPAAPAPEILLRARALGIPWERILLQEIRAEEALRRYLEDVEADWPLWSALTVLPITFLQTWRVRERVLELAYQAQGSLGGSALRQLRFLFRRLTRGPGTRSASVSLAEHVWFAYQRVLLLQRVARAAARSRGPIEERLAFICDRARCSHDDAQWALCREESPRRGHCLDDAIQKARDEGFQIPRAASGPKAFRWLRSAARDSAHRLRRRTSLPNPVRDRAVVPHPVPADVL